MADIIYPESKLRYLVNEIAKDIIPIDDILSYLGMSKIEYLELSQTRRFRDALSSANVEWQGATNTAKRVKLKAAAIVEEMLLAVFMSTKGETLAGQVKALEAVAKIGGLGALEPAVNANGGVMGNTFNLQINWAPNNGMNQTESFQLGSPVISETYSQELSDEESGEEESDDTDSGSTIESKSTFDMTPDSSSVLKSNISEVFGDDFDEL